MQEKFTIIPPEMNSKATFLEGGGKMGELIRAYDWEKTPLGSPENWPQSLKTCVRIMLTSRQPIWIGWGKDLIKLYNDPYKAIVGGNHPWALGQPASVVWRAIWEDIEPMLKTVMEKDEGTYVESQLLIMDRNGYLEETYYTFSYTPIPGDNGGTAGMICANTDDTSRIVGERQLRTLRDLGKSLAKMQTVTEVYQNALRVLENNQKDFPFAVLYKIDDEGRNADIIAYAGIDQDQSILPSHIDLLNSIEGTFNLCKAFNKKEIVIAENKGRRKNLPKGAWEIESSHFVHIPIITSGSTFPNAILTAALNPYRLYDETYRQFTTLIADQIALEVNNVMAYEAERKRAEALAEIDKAKTVFFSNISHEFRTPLTLMLGPLEDLLNLAQSHLTDEEKDKIETTHRNSMRLLRLVNNLLDFSRIEAGRAKAQFQLTDISTFTRDLAGSFRSAIENAGLYFNVNCEHIVQPIYVDRTMWEKIVLNLLSNAFKYTLTGGITVSLSVKNNNAELSICDTGVGIPREELPNLFQRFHRVQNVTGRTHEGTGIGLSLVSEFAKMHGGNISVSSKVNAGSEFVVTIPTGRKHLPLEQIDESGIDPEVRLADAFLEEADSLIGMPTDNKTDQAEQTHDTSYILVVDDNPDMRNYLKNILGRKFTVLTAANGIDALEKMQDQPPQLIVSDVMMPGMDGIQLLKAIKENKKYERIPVILLTARAGEESRIEGYQIGADDYLVKPFSTKELLARITAQLSMRERIEENEKQLEYFIKKAPVGIAIYKGPDFIVEAANDRVLEMWGKTLDEVKGKTLTDIFPEIITQEYARELYKASVEKFLKGETFTVNEVEFTFQRKGQPYKGWYNCTYEPLKDPNGNRTGIIAVVNEVTDQVMARKKIEESEEKFRTLATEFPLFVWLTDDKLQTTFLNKAGLEYFNFPQTTNIGELSWKKFIHTDDIERVLAVMNDAARDHKSYTLTMRLKNGRTGEYRWFVDNGVPQYFNGKFTGFIGTSMDIHEQKTADEKVRQSEERFRFLFDSNVLPVAFWHIGGEIYDANDSFLNLMGYTREEMQQGELNWRKFTLPEDAAMHEEKVRQAAEGKTVAPYQTQYINKKGESVSSLVGYAMLTGSKEKGIAFMQDIRKIKEVESALRQSEEKYRQLSMNLEEKVNERTEELRKLNEADKLKSDFIKMASHELKTPVTSIKGYTQLLLSALKEDENKVSPLLIRSSLISVDKQITRLTRLMSELLDLSKIETGMLVLSKEIFNLNELVIETVQDILYTNSKHNINIFHDFECHVYGDKDRIGQVLINFLTNAIKYSPNADKVEVWIRQSEKNWVSVSVKDFGIGIEEKDHEKIFERFYRAGGKEEQTFPGFGIGLFIAKEIVQRHGGIIGLTSEKGKGAVFTFTLPTTGNKTNKNE
jgi:PAS domain S-box-containing protein